MNYKGQEALLLWCKTNTTEYPGVQVQNFTTSWKDGLAYCALIHKFHPEVLQFDSLNKDKALDNLERAFSEASKLGVPRLFDPIDMMIEPKPDQHSVMTYLSQMYHVFERKDNPGMGIANITMVGPVPVIPPLNSSQSESNLAQHQNPRERPKFGRSLSTSNLPRPSTSGPQLQQRIPPLLKSGTLKYTAKKAPAQNPQESPPSPLEHSADHELVLEQAQIVTVSPATTPISTPVDPFATPSVLTTETSASVPPVLAAPVTSPLVISTNPTTINGPTPPTSPASPTSPNGKVTFSFPVTKTPAMEIPNSSPSTSARQISISSSGPISFPRSTTSPNISIALLNSSAAKAQEEPTKPAVLTFNPKPTSPTPSSSLPHSTSPSPVPTFISPSPSPTPPKVKVLGHKSAGEIAIKKAEEEKVVPKQPSTPPLQNRPDNTKLKRSQSVTNVTPKNWVNSIKGQGNYIRITDPTKVEIKKVVETEGPPGDGSDDESSKSQPTTPRRFMVDKVSSSSRGTWLKKLQNRATEEEDEDEYEYVDDDPNRIHEPIFNCDMLTLHSCLLRSTSTGKLTLPTVNRLNLKKVSFKDNLPSSESKDLDINTTLPTIPETPQVEEETVKEKVAHKETTSPISSQGVPREVAKEMLEAQLKANNTIKELERARDAAVFHRDEIAAKYAELELRLKEERAANDAMERETAELHQKLACVQEEAEAKFNTQMSTLTQKLADKDREILRLRMQNTTMKKKVEEKDKDIEKLKNSRPFSPPPDQKRSLSPTPELPIEDLESDNECRQTWENAARQQQLEATPPKTVSMGGVKISVDTTKIIVESPRSSTASPRIDMSPYSPDVVRRTNTPTKSESPQIEVAKVTYMYRSHTPTKPDVKYAGGRPHTPTKVEIIKKPGDPAAHHVRSPSLDQLPRVDSQSRITFQIPPKSPEPTKVVLSPKSSVRNSSGLPTVEVTNKPEEAKDGKTPGTPRLHAETSQGGLDPKPARDEPVVPAKPQEPKPEYRPGTLRSEASKPTIIFSPPNSPSPSPSPRPSPSPSPKSAIKYTTSQRHSSNPHSSNTLPTPSPTSPRSSSNPSPSASPSPSQQTTTGVRYQYPRNVSSASSSPSPNPMSPVPSPSLNFAASPTPNQPQNPSSSSGSSSCPNIIAIASSSAGSSSNSGPSSPNSGSSSGPSSGSSSAGQSSSSNAKDHHSKTAQFLNFITRGRSNTLPEPPAQDANGTHVVEHHGPLVSLLSPRSGQKIEVGIAQETAESHEVDKPMQIARIGRSQSLSSITPPKLNNTPTFVPPSTDIKPTWLVNLGRKITKPNDDNRI